MNDFEKFCTDHPATLIALLVIAIFLCMLIAFGVKVAVIVLGCMLAIVLCAYSVRRFNF